MTDSGVTDVQLGIVDEAQSLADAGRPRDAIALLTDANRAARDPRIECALVDLRMAIAEHAQPATRATPFQPVDTGEPDGAIFEIEPSDLTVDAVRRGLSQSGCVLIRGLVTSERVEQLVAGIDRAFTAFDEYAAGGTPEPGWFQVRKIPDRAGRAEGLRLATRRSGALWTAYSPAMLFTWFEVVEETGVADVMTQYLGERPFLSANKCTLRRVPLENLPTGWHQDGAFLGDDIVSFNVWVALTACTANDAPGIDIVPRRFGRVLPSGGGDAVFKWSLSDSAVREFADGVPIVRPALDPGDVLFFDHRLVHRTAPLSSTMVRERHAIESWFFAPSAYPKHDVPIYF